MTNKVILKYERKNNYWVCPCCDHENDISNNHCSLCHFLKVTETAPLNHRTSVDTRSYNNIVPDITTITTPYCKEILPSPNMKQPIKRTKPTNRSKSTEYKKLFLIWVIITAVILMLILIFSILYLSLR